MYLFFPTRNLMARWRFQIASSLHAAKSRLKSQQKIAAEIAAKIASVNGPFRNAPIGW